jgi:predicted kinase
VLVDANFRQERRRQTFLEAATAWGVPAALLVCRADAEVARRRLAGRRGDASDAGWEYYLEAAREWEGPGPRALPLLHELDANGGPERTLEAALQALRGRALA